MDTYIHAFRVGQEQAVRDNLTKEASAKDVASILSLLGDAGKSAGKSLGSLLKSTKDVGTKAKYLGTVADPRSALLAGGSGLAAGLIPAISSASRGDLGEALIRAGGATAAGLGAGLAMGAHPGMLGGSMGSRVTHELAMQARTPAGLIGTMASVVGLPAALIAYGKMKGKEEASIF